jgi:hypothetical protein
MSQNNNICPLAFEVPTKEQLSKETVNIKNTSGAFSSFLKIEFRLTTIGEKIVSKKF